MSESWRLTYLRENKQARKTHDWLVLLQSSPTQSQKSPCLTQEPETIIVYKWTVLARLMLRWQGTTTASNKKSARESNANRSWFVMFRQELQNMSHTQNLVLWRGLLQSSNNNSTAAATPAPATTTATKEPTLALHYLELGGVVFKDGRSWLDHEGLVRPGKKVCALRW